MNLKAHIYICILSAILSSMWHSAMSFKHLREDEPDSVVSSSMFLDMFCGIANKTRRPIKEPALIPTPRGDDKSGGDGGSKDDNSKNGRVRTFYDIILGCLELQNPFRRGKSVDLRSEDNLRTIFLAAHVADI